MRKLAFKKSSGFTLIEMMITVGIIGILVMISIPVYSTYQSRTRQSEAKTALAAIYAGEKSFQSEYTVFVSSLEAIHYEPEGLKRFYTVGWSGPTPGSIQGFSGSMGSSSYDRQGTPPDFGCPPAMATPLLPAPVPAGGNAFTAGAAGEVRVSAGCDLWKIDDNKTLSNSTLAL